MSLVFLDFDDVLCLGRPYGLYEAALPERPPDYYERLFDASCVAALRSIDKSHAPRYVITTSWLRFFDREGMVSLLVRSGLNFVANNLHEDWEALPTGVDTRAGAIERWLVQHHAGEAFAVLDDVRSGSGLSDSVSLRGHIVFCQENVGLTGREVALVASILTSSMHWGRGH